MKKAIIWTLVLLLVGGVATAGWYAYDNGVRNVDQLVTFAKAEWQRLTHDTPQAPDTPALNEPTPAKPDMEVDVVTRPAPEAFTVEEPTETTNKFSIFTEGEDEEYNPLLLGHWICVDQPSWHRIYTDEYSGNGYYWGKEWDEADDISEADLIDYGNGWFEWKMDGNDVLELATSDMSETRVPFIYTIKKLSDKDLIYIEQRSTEKRVFKRL